MVVVQLLVWMMATGCHHSRYPLTFQKTTNRNNNVLRNVTSSPLEQRRGIDNVINEASDNGGDHDNDCIYVPGGGFSGFWFSLGRLQSLRLQPLQPQDVSLHKENFVCYSAGCLGVVATLLRLEQDELYDMARQIQLDWLQGRLHRYQVVEAFVDGILQVGLQRRRLLLPEQSDEQFFRMVQNNLHIVTTTTSPSSSVSGIGGWLQATIQQPHDLPSLKQMLLQTTWIPMAVGASFSFHGHLDGAFSTLQHPKCRRAVGLAVPIFEPPPSYEFSTAGASVKYWGLLRDSWKLWGNTLNVNLGKQVVQDLFELGLDYGV